MSLFLQGFMIGLAYVAPIGVQNMFCINTALTQPRKKVYATAFIILFFDIALSISCFFGVGAIMDASKWLQFIILGLGSILVIYIGIGLLRAKGEADGSKDVNIPLAKVIVTAFIVTWLNPQALIDGSLLLGAFKASISADQARYFILGVCTASASWWMGISTIFSLFKKKVTSTVFRIINLICGCIIIFYGVKLLLSFIKMAMAMFG